VSAMRRSPESEGPGPGPERRKYPRIRDDCRLRFRRVEAREFFAASGEALTRNISGGGLCFRPEPDGQRPCVGDVLALELELPEFGSPVLALGRVVRAGDGDDGPEVAVEFWWIGWGDEEAQRRIGGYIKKKLGIAPEPDAAHQERPSPE